MMGRATEVDADVSVFRPGDQDVVRSLILEGLGEHWGHIDESLNLDLADIASTYGHGRTAVVRLAGEVVATGTVVPRDESTAEILRMSVAADHRRFGLGRLVVEELVKILGTAFEKIDAFRNGVIGGLDVCSQGIG